ncbi:MAG: AbiV family abortive infection protein [Candidatus Limnocylindrales bacterium]
MAGRQLPNRDESLAGARRATANARTLCKAAQTLDEAGFCGPAVTMLGTAAEEAAKAGVLVLLASEAGSAGPEEQQLMRLIFKDHRTKYRLAWWASGATSPETPQTLGQLRPDEVVAALGFVLALVAIIYAFRRGEPLPETPSLDADAAPFLIELARADPDGPPGWLSKAVRLRQAGMHVEFDNGTWRGPDDLGHHDVAEARRAVLPLVRGASRWARTGSAVF